MNNNNDKLMGAKTKIEWADATWNPIIGCSHVSTGCNNCYAERVAARFEWNKNSDESLGYYYDVASNNGWRGVSVRKTPKFNPLTAWKPRTIFVCSMGDLFHKSVPDEWIDEVMDVIATAKHHRFMLLTKRPERMLEYMLRYCAEASPVDDPETLAFGGIGALTARDILPNLALGVSIENQATADERVPLLLQTPAAKRFVSYEPALGSITMLEEWMGICPECGGGQDSCKSSRVACCPDCGHGRMTWLDLIIMGGESGPKARPMHLAWARLMRDQCQEAGVPFHFKSWGEYCYPTQMPEETFRAWDYRHGEENAMPKPWRVGKRAAGRLIDGKEYNGQIEWEGRTC